MKERLLFGAVAVMIVFGALVDFASAFISRIVDSFFGLFALAAALVLYRMVKTLRADNKALRAKLLEKDRSTGFDRY